MLWQMHCLIELQAELTQKALDDQISFCANAGCFLLCILGSDGQLKDVPSNKGNCRWSKSVWEKEVCGSVCLAFIRLQVQFLALQKQNKQQPTFKRRDSNENKLSECSTWDTEVFYHEQALQAILQKEQRPELNFQVRTPPLDVSTLQYSKIHSATLHLVY